MIRNRNRAFFYHPGGEFVVGQGFGWATSFQIAVHPHAGTPNAQRKQKPQLSQYPLHLTRNPTFCQTSFYKNAFSSSPSSYKKTWRGRGCLDCLSTECTHWLQVIRIKSCVFFFFFFSFFYHPGGELVVGQGFGWATSFQIAAHPERDPPANHTSKPETSTAYAL